VKYVPPASAQASFILIVFKQYSSHRKLQEMLPEQWQGTVGQIRYYIIGWLGGGGHPYKIKERNGRAQ
jgi:hypothetical protein